MTYVWGCGPIPADILLLGERPGEEEHNQGVPFVGPSGQEQVRYLLKAGITEQFCYKTNIVKDYLPNNPDPEPWEVERDWPLFLEELEDVQPSIIGAIGRFASRALIGDWVTMDVCHGKSYYIQITKDGKVYADLGHIPDGAYLLDPILWSGWVIPIYHPAGGLWNNDMQPVIQYDYRMLGAYYKGKVKPVQSVDQYPTPKYINVFGTDFEMKEMNALFSGFNTIAIDTEFDPLTKKPWSIQYCFTPGTAYTILCNRPLIIKEFRNLMHAHQPHVVMQGALVDLHVLKKLDIHVKSFEDTQVMAYQLQIEPKGLKPLAQRHCGMSMQSYNDLVGPVEGQMIWDWLKQASNHDFGPAEERVKWKGGKYTISKGWTINRKIIRLLADLESGKAIPHEVKKKRILKKDAWHPEDLTKVESQCGPIPAASLQDVSLSDAVYYASRDPDATLRVRPILKDMCSVMSLDKSLTIDHGAIPMIEHMQTHGIACDTQYLKDFSEELQSMLDRTAYKAEKVLNRFINLNSGDQMAAQFYTRNWRGIPVPKYKTESGRPKMDEAALQTIKVELKNKPTRTNVQDKAIRIIDLALNYRECLKLKTTYADPIVKIVDSGSDGRLHSNFRITQVVSGRLSATKPNVLAFPSRTDLGKRIKGAFRASDGHMMGTADYSGIEMRVMAHMAQDEAMMDVFRQGRDLHNETASKIFDKPIDQIDKMTERYPSKSMGFLIIYGGGGSTLQDNMKEVGLNWPLDRCNELISEWLKLYHGVDKFMQHQEAYAKRHGFVRTMHGRIRYLPGIWSPIYSIQQEAKRMAINHPIQGSAQEIIKIAMAKLWSVLQELWADGFSIHPLLQIHDELMHEFEEGIKDFVDQLFIDTMEDAVELSVPVKVDSAYGYTWEDLDK